MPVNSYKNLNFEEVLARYNEVKSIRKTAKHFKVHKNTIKKVLREVGIVEFPKHVYKIPGTFNGIYIRRELKSNKKIRMVEAVCPVHEGPWILDFHAITSKKVRCCKPCSNSWKLGGGHTKYKFPTTINGIEVLKRTKSNKNRDWYVLCRCPECGKTWETSLSNLVRKTATKCRPCANKDIITIGKNETALLDLQEKKDGVIIARGVSILKYCVDGYCFETNTIYEVYEKHHKYQITADLQREQDLRDELNCEFVIIWDLTN